MTPHPTSAPTGNLFTAIPTSLPDELIEVLLRTPRLRIERIVSRGQATPAGQWYDQDADEWVSLLSGRAGLRIEGRDGVQEMTAGDYLHLPAHVRHRVEWTDPGENTIWLAVHFQP